MDNSYAEHAKLHQRKWYTHAKATYHDYMPCLRAIELSSPGSCQWPEVPLFTDPTSETAYYLRTQILFFNYGFALPLSRPRASASSLVRPRPITPFAYLPYKYPTLDQIVGQCFDPSFAPRFAKAASRPCVLCMRFIVTRPTTIPAFLSRSRPRTWRGPRIF